MFAIRARRKTVTEKDFLDAVNKVIKGYQKFSATPKYMVYNWVNCFASFPKKNLECSYGLSNWAWYELYGLLGDCIVNFISVIWTWTCIYSDYITYHLLQSNCISVGHIKLWKCIKLCFSITLFRDYFHHFWNRCNLLGIWKLLFFPPPLPPLYACLLCFI